MFSYRNILIPFILHVLCCKQWVAMVVIHFCRQAPLQPYSCWYSRHYGFGTAQVKVSWRETQVLPPWLSDSDIDIEFELLLILCFKRTTVILKIQFLFCMNCNSYFCDCGFWWRYDKCHKHLQEKLGNIVKICTVQCRLKRLLVVISQLSVAGVSSGDAISYLRVTSQNTVNISTLSLL